jgi:hypothetical protein
MPTRLTPTTVSILADDERRMSRWWRGHRSGGPVSRPGRTVDRAVARQVDLVSGRNGLRGGRW